MRVQSPGGICANNGDDTPGAERNAAKSMFDRVQIVVADGGAPSVVVGARVGGGVMRVVTGTDVTVGGTVDGLSTMTATDDVVDDSLDTSACEIAEPLDVFDVMAT